MLRDSSRTQPASPANGGIYLQTNHARGTKVDVFRPAIPGGQSRGYGQHIEAETRLVALDVMRMCAVSRTRPDRLRRRANTILGTDRAR